MRLYVFTDRIGADTMLKRWLEDSKTPCLVEYYGDGSWTAARPNMVKEGSYTVLLPGNESEIRYAPRCR